MNTSPFSLSIVQPNQLFEISRVVTEATEWKPALDEIIKIVRNFFIFDNLAIYLKNPVYQNLDVIYARAVGRGRNAEADIAWGELLASKITSIQQTILEEPIQDPHIDRLDRPFLLGIPMVTRDEYHGALTIIRFGGPPFINEEIEFSEYLSNQIALLTERHIFQVTRNSIETRQRELQLQQDFLSNISHELRNPIGFIKGYTTTLLRSDATWDTETQREFLEIIDRETDHLQELINNLLDSSRLQTGQMPMKYQKLRLDALMHDVIAHSRLHHPELDIELNITGLSQTIWGDPQRLSQVVENLVNNANKYAPGSKVVIGINQDENKSTITVEDFGPGINSSYLPYIFDRFFRCPDQISLHGSGLGLFICKQIVEAHSGTIFAVSTVGKGTTFSISLPNEQHIQEE